MRQTAEALAEPVNAPTAVANSDRLTQPLPSSLRTHCQARLRWLLWTQDVSGNAAAHVGATGPEEREMGEQGIGRRQLLAGMGAGTLGAMAALGASMTPVLAKESEGNESEARVEGSWQAVIHVEQPPDKAATFPAMFGFAGGGVVTRVDGRDNAPSLGTWKRSGVGIVFQRIEYQFAAGVLVRTVNVLAAAEVHGDSMSGTFTGLVAGSFFRSGSFTATRVPAKGP